MLVAADAWEPATSRCREHIRDLGLSRHDVAQVILQLNPGEFRKHFGPCATEFGDFNADDYLIWVDDVTFQRCAPHRGIRLYIKFAIRSTPVGDDCLVVSFHESISR